jgi:hypothetical protein
MVCTVVVAPTFVMALVTLTESQAAMPSRVEKLPPDLLNSLSMKQMARLKSKFDESTCPSPCGYWCDDDLATLRQRIAEGLRLSPRKLGIMRFENLAASLFFSRGNAAVVVRLGSDRRSLQVRLVERGIVESYLRWPEDTDGAALVVNTTAQASFRSIGKVAIVPVLAKSRSLWNYYISSGVWDLLVSSHCAHSIMGFEFFKARTKYPVFWHTLVWTFFGTFVLVALAAPLLWKPLFNFFDALDRRFQESVEVPKQLCSPVGQTGPSSSFEFPDPFLDRSHRLDV